MNNGPAPSADGPENGSSTTPTAGPMSEQSSTDAAVGSFLITAANLSERLQQMYRYGWDMAKAVPGLDSPPEIDFRVEIDNTTRVVTVTAIIR